MRVIPAKSLPHWLSASCLALAALTSTACTSSNPRIETDAGASDAVGPGADATGGQAGDARPDAALAVDAAGGTSLPDAGHGGTGGTGGLGGTGGSPAPDAAGGHSPPPADGGVGDAAPDGGVLDSDGDGVPDDRDNCAAVSNPDQTDTDLDGQGDACDVCPVGGSELDLDGDGARGCDGDCDDTDPRRYPGAVERCDGLDNNCDLQVDETFTDLGQPCSAGVGLCARQGTLDCGADQQSLRCNAVPGVQLPETCDNQDNDCDGSIDEEVPDCCEPGTEQPCGQAIGRCTAGVQRCSDNRAWGACNAVGPRAEACDGVDDDCDGQIDNGVLNACGACGPVPVEICDGADNDCDGRVDNGVLNACGECGAVPMEICDGVDNDCDGQVDEGLRNACGGCGPVPPEVCDGVDNDCDGQVDEGVLNACGHCGDVPQEICDGLDNNCDGQIDEGLINACGQCGPAPVEVCDGLDNNCNGQVDEGVLNACGHCGPVPAEVCDGFDNNCDGRIDEGVLNACGQCGPLPAEVCDGLDNNCDGRIDEGVLNACGQCGPVPAEICDGLDNNCNGQIDEGVGPCGNVEICDGLDNDGDGQVDEDLHDICIVHLGVSGQGTINRGLGATLAVVGDLTGDGIPDVVAGAPSLADAALALRAIDGATGAEIWHVDGDGKLGTSLVAGRFYADGHVYVAAGAPTAVSPNQGTGVITVFAAADGTQVQQLQPFQGRHFGESLASGYLGGNGNIEDLVLGDSTFDDGNGAPANADHGRVLAVELGAVNNVTVLSDARGDMAGRHLGERVFVVDGGFGAGRHLVTTLRRDAERSIVTLNGNALGTEWRSPEAMTQSYGQALAAGRFGASTVAVGGTRATFGGAATAGVVFLQDALGAVVSRLSDAFATGEEGYGLAVMARPAAQTDALIIGGRMLGHLDAYDPGTSRTIQVTEVDAATSYGRAFALSEPLANGTRRLFVGEPGYRNGRGRVFIYSIR